MHDNACLEPPGKSVLPRRNSGSAPVSRGKATTSIVSCRSVDDSTTMLVNFAAFWLLTLWPTENRVFVSWNGKSQKIVAESVARSPCGLGPWWGLGDSYMDGLIGQGQGWARIEWPHHTEWLQMQEYAGDVLTYREEIKTLASRLAFPLLSPRSILNCSSHDCLLH